jgi:hypothetical protein
VGNSISRSPSSASPRCIDVRSSADDLRSLLHDWTHAGITLSSGDPRRVEKKMEARARTAGHAARRWLSCLAVATMLTGFGDLRAADFYACDCAAGADPQCVAGDDAVAGTSPKAPWRSYGRARDQWPMLTGGDSIHFCRGGVFPISGSTQWVNDDCRADQRCSIGAYVAPWAGGDEAPPRIVQSQGHGFAFVNAGDPEPEEGVVLRDLEVACTGCVGGQWGVFLYNNIDDLRMQRLHIHGFDIGVHLAGANACAVPGCDRANERIELLESDITDNLTMGWLGADQELLIADNRFLRNGAGTVFQHNLYLTQSGGATTGIRVLRNELYRSAARASGSCQGGSFASHGEHTDLLIEGNFVHEDLGAADPACWGIGLTPAYDTPEAFVRAVIRGNRIRNLGNVAIAIASCVDCIVENNIVESEQAFGGIAILAPAVARGSDDATLTGLAVRNNSIHLAAGGSTGIRVGDEGTQHVIVSNALQSTAMSGAWSCLSLTLAPASYSAVDNNACGFVAGGGREWEQGSGSLAAWRGTSGFDLQSVAIAPGFASPGAPDHDLQAESAAAPMVGLGHATLSAVREYFGQLRGALPDAGAHQIGVAPGVFADGFED